MLGETIGKEVMEKGWSMMETCEIYQGSSKTFDVKPRREILRFVEKIEEEVLSLIHI